MAPNLRTMVMRRWKTRVALLEGLLQEATEGQEGTVARGYPD